MADGTRMQQRRATEAVWTTSDYVLAAGELGVTTDTGIIKVGNGTSPWSELDIAFEDLYLPILATATNSELLGGLSADTFVKEFDAVSTVTNNAVARRTATGTLKAATAVATDDLTTKAQVDANITTARQIFIARTVTTNTTALLADINSIVRVNHASLTAQVTVTIPENATTAFPVGSWFDVYAIGEGGAKIIPASGTVVLRGTVNVFPGYGIVRLLKVDVDVWVGIELRKGKRLPKIRAVRTGGTSYGTSSFICVPYDSIDSTIDFYNPDNEWFSVPGTGLPTARRILINKDGEYLVTANFITNVTILGSFIIAKMVNDNTLTGARYLFNGPAFVTSNLHGRVRLAAGESIGCAYAPPGSGASDLADGSSNYRNDLTITRLGD